MATKSSATVFCSLTFLSCLIISCGTSASTGATIRTLTADEFHTLLPSKDDLLIYYNTDRCQEDLCREDLNVLKTVLSDIHVVHLNSPDVMKKYGITRSPSLLYFRKTYPILYTENTLIAEDLETWLHMNREVSTRLLDDNSFEHLTQASTGATTGDWFVMFYKKTCDEQMAVWEAVASRLKHRMNFAKVDIEENPKLKERFDISSCPTLHFFRLGNMYTYNLRMGDYNSMVSFAEGWYKNAPAVKVLPEPTPFDLLVESVVKYLKHIMERPEGQIILIVGTLINFLLFIACCVLCGGKTREKLD